MASLPPGHAQLRSPASPRQGASPLCCRFSHLPQRVSNQRAFPSHPPAAAALLALTLAPEGAAEALGLGTLWGWAERSGWDWGPSPLPLPSPSSLAEPAMWTGSGCTEHLPAQPHTRELRMSRRRSSRVQDRFPLHLPLPSAISLTSPRRCSTGSILEPMLLSEYCVLVFPSPHQLGWALEPIR